ncbi:hypothetical protein J4410_05215 [Candidatus Woesearchaeota archaeon]|nr:hypothetical protein [Candidatus Woesearchaeota archaeon]
MKKTLFLFVALALLMLSACTSTDKAQKPYTPEELQENAERQDFKVEAEQENWEEYCKEKYTDNKRRLSNAENDLAQHTLDLADAEEANDEKQVTIFNQRIQADEEDIAETKQWIEETKKECAGVVLE